jgi:hypothetical protein
MKSIFGGINFCLYQSIKVVALQGGVANSGGVQYE